MVYVNLFTQCLRQSPRPSLSRRTSPPRDLILTKLLRDGHQPLNFSAILDAVNGNPCDWSKACRRQLEAPCRAKLYSRVQKCTARYSCTPVFRTDGGLFKRSSPPRQTPSNSFRSCAKNCQFVNRRDRQTKERT